MAGETHERACDDPWSGCFSGSGAYYSSRAFSTLPAVHRECERSRSRDARRGVEAVKLAPRSNLRILSGESVRVPGLVVEKCQIRLTLALDARALGDDTDSVSLGADKADLVFIALARMAVCALGLSGRGGI